MQRRSVSNRHTAGVGADDVAVGLRRDARIARSFLAHHRRRSMLSGDLAAAEDYRRWCESSWAAFVHRDPDTKFDLDALAQRWRLMAYASDLRDPVHRLRSRCQRLPLMVVGVVAAAAILVSVSPIVGVAAGLVCGGVAVHLERRRELDGTGDLVVGPDASPKVQMRASWHWNHSDFR